MATPPVTPSISAPAPAPAPVAAPAPVVTPAAPIVAPAAPVVSAPVADAPAPVVTDIPAPVVAPAATEAPTQPKAADFEDPAEFLGAHSKWERDNAEWLEKNLAKPAEASATPEVEAAKVEEDSKIEEAVIPEDVPAPTPAALDKLIKGDEALKAALEANPKAKGELMKMARELAEAKPIASLFPTVESAQFAQQTANEYVGLRSKFEMAVESGDINDAFTSFVDQFTIIGTDGKPVLDAKGQPQLAEDFNLLTSHIRQLDIDGNISELTERLEAAKAGTYQYKSDAARERDEQRLMAFEFIKDDAVTEDKPDYSALPEQTRKDLETRDARIKELEDAQKGKEQGQTKEAKAATRQQWETDFGREHAKSLLTQSEAVIKDLRAAGALIPPWMLTVKGPDSNVPVFYLNVLNKFKAAIKADAYTQKQAKSFQMLTPTPENLKARVEYFDGLAKQHLRTIIVDEVRTQVKKEEPEAASPVAEPNPSIEPRGGAAPAPVTGMTQEQARDTAREQLAKEIPGWTDLDPSERNGYVLTRIARLMRK